MNQATEKRSQILIVTDDQSQLEQMSRLLRSSGYGVSSVQSCRAAIETVGELPTDLIVVGNGQNPDQALEMCRRLKEERRRPGFPILAASNQEEESNWMEAALAAGADDFIQLPFRPAEFLARIGRLVDRFQVEMRYRDIVERAAHMIYTCDLEGVLTSINEAGSKFFGRPAYQLIGRAISELIGNESASREIEQMQAARSFEPVRFIRCWTNALGEQRYLEEILTLEFRAAAEPLGVRGVLRDITEQQRIEKALRESETRYRVIAETTSEGIVTFDASGRILFANPAAEDIFGYTSNEIIGDSLTTVLPDYFVHLHQSEVWSLKRIVGAEKSSVNLSGRHKSGQVLPIEASFGEVVVDEQRLFTAVLRDLSERRQSEAALRLQDERYRILFDSSPCPMYVCDERTLKFLAVNQAAITHYGYSREDFLEMSVLDIRPAGERAKIIAYVSGTNRTHDAAGIWKHRKKDGSLIDVEVNWHKLDFAGKPCYLVMANDVTSTCRAELAVKQSEERYRELVENANDIVYTHDLRGNFTSLNKTGERITGYSCKEALKMNIVNVLSPDSVDTARQMLASKQLNRTPTIYELEIISKAGQHIPLEVSTRLIFDDGVPVGVQGIARDITERKLAKEALAQQVQRSALTNRISQAVRRTLDLSEVFQTAVRELGAHLEVDRCSLFMKDEPAGRVMNVAEYHVSGVGPAGQDFDLPQIQGLNSAIEKCGVLVFDDVANDERLKDLYPVILEPFKVKSIIYVGVTVGDELLGALALSTTREARQWSPADIEVAKAVADQTGIAIRQARLYQKAEATSMREALVNKLSAAIRASLSLTSMLDTAARELGQELKTARVTVLLYEPDGDQLKAQREYMMPEAEKLFQPETYWDFLDRHFVGSLKPLVISDAKQLSDRDFGGQELSGIKAQINYPLIVNDQFRGVISIHHSDTLRHWTEDELLLVESVASQLATGVAQAELFDLVTRAKKEWESTFDAMSDGIFIFDRSGRLIRVNRAGAAMDNAVPEHLLGKHCCKILSTSADHETCIVERALKFANSINVEIVPQSLNRPILVTVEPIVDERSQTIGAVCTARDLSELRQVEAVARERQSLLQNILESAREAIYAVDHEGNYQWCNQAMIEMTGYRINEIIGHNFLERTHDADREMRTQIFAEALAGEPQSFEARYLARDGSVRYASVNNAPIIVDGVTTGVLGIAHDITEQKQERERAARSDKLRALGQLASGVAHDFNNSLAAILGRAQLILRRVKDEELVRSLGIIVTAAEDAAATVRRIQTFARKSLETELQLVEIGGLLRDAIEITRTRWQNEARAAGLRIDVQINSQPDLIVRANASELREVFVNLIVNAVDAMPQGGSLKILSRAAGDLVKVQFADTGTGMRDDVRERIFEPFYTTKGVHGTGLGLAVSYGIIERHKGQISVESKLGQGSTFTIDLPLAGGSERPANDKPALSKWSSLSILVIDDEQFVRETLAEMLTDLDHTVTTANGGREAIEKLEGHEFDLVFTDLAMPEMDGWETARAIRKRLPDVPVILVTGYGATAEPPSGERNLVTGIIGKPFDFDQVSGTIAKVCGVQM